MTTLAKHIIVAGAENRPPMLEKSMYDSWASRIRLFIKGKKHGRMMLDSIDNGLLVYPTVEENRQTRPKKYSELTEAQQLQDDCDVLAANIILHVFPPDVYALVNHQEAAKDIWDIVNMLMKGTELSYQEHECRLYNLFDKFAHVPGKTMYAYYWRFSQLINDMHTIGMTMQQVQVNTKFLNALPSKWSKCVTDVKLDKSLYTTNYDQLYAYLSQHERHANEVRINRERYLDSLAFVANSPTLYNPSQSPQHLSYSIYLPPQQFIPVYAAPIHHQHHHTPVNPQGEDPIECINKTMAFLSAVASRFPPSNNQLRTSSNPRNQATIQDVGPQRVMKCYNYQGEWHMARQCTQTKRPRNAAWFKEKLMLAEAQEAGQILDEEQLAFLADPGISEALVAHQTILQNSAFQTDDLDAYGSNCDDLSSAKAVPMANLSSCDPEVLSEVSYSESYLNDMINQDVQEIQYSEQTHVDDFEDNEIHSDSQMDDLIRDRNAKLATFQQEIDTLKETLSNNVKEKESLSKTLTVFKTESKEKDIIAKEHAMIFVIDDEETLILEEESRSKMLDKQNDPVSIEKKIKISPIDYSKLNKIKEDFGKFLKDTFNAFDKTLLDEITEVQTVFNQIESVVDQCSIDKNVFEIQIKQLRIDNDQLLNQIMSQEIMHIFANSVDIFDVKKSCVNDCSKCLVLETEIFKKKDFIEKEAYDKLVKSYSNLEKHCISLELATQLNQEIFQRENFGENLNAPTFNQLFEINELKAQSQEKNTVIRKLKERIKSFSRKDSVENVKKDIDEIETISIELEHSMAKLLSENENLRKE
ncbi:hypothetical protein Tco_0448473 [Tanacetum coccineum]